MDEFDSSPTVQSGSSGLAADSCCQVSKLLKASLGEPTSAITIIDAYKGAAPEGPSGSTGGFVSYGIKFMDLVVRRRYSDFEGLRKYFESAYPTAIVPPIPEKHTLGNYATTQKAKEDQQIMEKRKRLLQSFLNRVHQHPVLCSDHLFHRFIETSSSWGDVVAAENVKKEKLSLPSGKPKNVEPKFVEYESQNIRSAKAFETIDRANRKLSKKYLAVSEDLMDLGAAFNGFSLEDTQLSATLEKFGQTLDASQQSTEKIAKYFGEVFGDSLHEIFLYSQSVRNTLKYRTSKQLAYEELCEQIFSKKSQLLQLESRRSKSGLSWVSSSINNLVDNDPEQSRSNALVKTKDLIAQLEEAKEQALHELNQVSSEVEEEIKRLQEGKIKDWNRLIKAVVREQVKYHEENAQLWERGVNDLAAIA